MPFLKIIKPHVNRAPFPEAPGFMEVGDHA